jgi:hypothetical protein
MKRGVVSIILNALIWAFVLFASAYALRGTGAYEKIQLILGGGAAASLMAVGFGVAGKKDAKNGAGPVR